MANNSCRQVCTTCDSLDFNDTQWRKYHRRYALQQNLEALLVTDAVHSCRLIAIRKIFQYSLVPVVSPSDKSLGQSITIPGEARGQWRQKGS